MWRFPGFSRSETLARAVRAAVGVVLVAVVAGCKDGTGVSTPTMPSLPRGGLSGNWSATLTGLSLAGADGRLTATFEEWSIDAERGILKGTWSLTALDGTTTRSGTVTGVINRPSALIELVAAPRPPCPQGSRFALFAGSLTLVVTIDAARMSGSVAAYGCTEHSESSIELRR